MGADFLLLRGFLCNAGLRPGLGPASAQNKFGPRPDLGPAAARNKFGSGPASARQLPDLGPAAARPRPGSGPK